MSSELKSAAAMAILASLAWHPAAAQTSQTRTAFVDLGSGGNAVLYEPETPGAKTRIAFVYTHESTGNHFRHPSGRELSARGYRVLLINHYNQWIGFEAIAPVIGSGIRYLRELPGVEKVVLLGHSGGGPLMSFYQNIAENGPGACQGPGKIYPCKGDLSNLPKADGLLLLDSHIGTGFELLTYTDPAILLALRQTSRDASLDMFHPRNGYDPGGQPSAYSSGFARKFFAAQAARNADVIEHALARLALIEKGEGDYRDDEPFVVPGTGARLLQPDPRILSRTHDPHPLLKVDGSMPTQIIRSVRPVLRRDRAESSSYEHTTRVSTVRQFLAGYALRTTADYNMAEDSITGVDWASSNTSATSNIKGVTIPTLIVAMSCHYFLVPDELIYNNSPSRDKQYVLLEGASHGFTPCRPEYGDTVKRLFDFVDGWASQASRFGSR